MKLTTVLFASFFAASLCVSFTKIKRIPSEISLKATPNVVIEGVYLNGNQMYLDQTLLKQNVLNLQYYLVTGDIFEVRMKKSGDGVSGINGMIQFMEGKEGSHRGFHTGVDWICNKKEPKKEMTLQKGDEQGTWIWADDSSNEVSCSFKIPCPDKEATNVFKNTNQVVTTSQAVKKEIAKPIEETKKTYNLYFCQETKRGYDTIYIPVRLNKNKQLKCAIKKTDDRCNYYDSLIMCNASTKILTRVDDEMECPQNLEECKEIANRIQSNKSLKSEMELSAKHYNK